MKIFQDYRTYLAIAAIIAGVLLWFNLPKRVEKVEQVVAQLSNISVEQKVIVNQLKDNQRMLIGLHLKGE